MCMAVCMMCERMCEGENGAVAARFVLRSEGNVPGQSDTATQSE